MTATETPDGLSPGPDGTFYGEYRHVPDGWECWTGSTFAPWVKGDELGPVDDAIVQCSPPKPKWTANGHVVISPVGAMIHCYRPRDGSPGEAAVPSAAPELAERVARLLNEWRTTSERPHR